MKYKITIEKITETDETVSQYENKVTKDHKSSIYTVDDNEKVNWVEVRRPTGRKVLHYEDAYSQVVELDDITDVIRAANNL